MDDRLRETLSAMMDDEADELSVRRLLSYPEQNQVREQWRRWQQIRDLMHGGHGPAEGMDVSASVRAVLDGRSGAGPESAPARRAGGASWHWPVVAMVTLALVIGFGAGAALVGLGAALVVMSKGEEAPAEASNRKLRNLRLDVAPTRQGAAAGLTFQF